MLTKKNEKQKPELENDKKQPSTSMNKKEELFNKKKALKEKK